MYIGYSVKEAAAAFKPALPVRVIKRALASGALPSVRAGQSRVILSDDLLIWARTLPAFEVSPLVGQHRRKDRIKVEIDDEDNDCDEEI